MPFIPEKYCIYHFDCNTNGRLRTCTRQCHSNLERGYGASEDCHYYLVITSSYYNRRTEHITAVPLTSKKNLVSGEFCIELIGEYLNGDSKNSKLRNTRRNPSYIMCDKPCKIHINNITNPEVEGKVSHDGLKKILSEISRLLAIS